MNNKGEILEWFNYEAILENNCIKENRDDCMKENVKYQIHCYKHNGKVHRIWEEADIIEETDDYIICGNYKTDVIEIEKMMDKKINRNISLLITVKII